MEFIRNEFTGDTSYVGFENIFGLLFIHIHLGRLHTKYSNGVTPPVYIISTLPNDALNSLVPNVQYGINILARSEPAVETTCRWCPYHQIQIKKVSNLGIYTG